MQHAGHPVFGDPVYGGRSRLRGIAPEHRGAASRALELIGRQALHASRLAFEHPSTGKAASFSSPLPEDIGEGPGAAAEAGVNRRQPVQALAVLSLLAACAPAPRYTSEPAGGRTVVEELRARQRALRNSSPRRLLEVANGYLGIPYKWGGTTRRGNGLLRHGPGHRARGLRHRASPDLEADVRRRLPDRQPR